MLLGSHESKANRASRVQGGFRFTITTYLLLDGSNSMASEKPTFVVEGGVENYNPAVEQFIESGFLKRVLVDKAIPLIDFDDRVVVTPEEAQGVYQPVRPCTSGPQGGHPLRPTAQHASTLPCAPRADARRMLFRQWNTHSVPTEGRTIGGLTVTT